MTFERCRGELKTLSNLYTSFRLCLHFRLLIRGKGIVILDYSGDLAVFQTDLYSFNLTPSPFVSSSNHDQGTRQDVGLTNRRLGFDPDPMTHYTNPGLRVSLCGTVIVTVGGI